MSKNNKRQSKIVTLNATKASTAGTDELLTVDETAEYLKMSRAFVYGLMKRGELPFRPLGTRRRRIRKTDLENYLENNAVGSN